MIIVERELVYGIDIYRFRTSKNIPYQLTFEKDLTQDRINVHLANLYACEPDHYDKEVRKIVCDIVFEYLSRTNCTLFFEIEVTHERNDLTMVKFIRWAYLYPMAQFKYEITQLGSTFYLEAYITKKKN